MAGVDKASAALDAAVSAVNSATVDVATARKKVRTTTQLVSHPHTHSECTNTTPHISIKTIQPKTRNYSVPTDVHMRLSHMRRCVRGARHLVRTCTSVAETSELNRRLTDTPYVGLAANVYCSLTSWLAV